MAIPSNPYSPFSGRLKIGSPATGWGPRLRAWARIHRSMFFSRMIYLVAIIELPGVNKEDLNIQAKENTIRIAGQKGIEFPVNVSLHRRERLSGVFDRTIVVPMQIDPNGIKAEYNDGLLAIFIPRAKKEKPRTIEIK